MRILLAAGEDGNAVAQPQSSPEAEAVDPTDRLVDADHRALGLMVTQIDWTELL